MSKEYATGEEFPAAEQNEIVRTTGLYATDAGGDDDYAITVSPVPDNYTDGDEYTFKPSTANTGPATLDVNSLGQKAIKKITPLGKVALDTGDIYAGEPVRVKYDGTDFVVMSPIEPATIISPLNSKYFVFQIPAIPTTNNFVALGGDANAAKGGYMILEDSGSGAVSAQYFLQGASGGTAGNLQFDTTKKIILAARVKFSEAGTNKDAGGIGFGGNAVQDMDLADVTGSVCFSVSRVAGVHKLYSKSADGSVVESNEITDISFDIGNLYDVMIEWLPGTYAKFYINGVLKFTHTTRLPASAASDIYGWVAGVDGNALHCSALTIAIEK